MTTRLTAPDRSPLRRIPLKGKDGGQRKQSKSPIRKADAGKKTVGYIPDPEAEALRIQADECEKICHELTHLTPVLQRFWQRSDEFSPRSKRLSMIVPKPRSAEGTAMAKLNHLRVEVSDTMDRGRKVQELTASLLTRYFETIPYHKLSETIRAVFDSFDANRDGMLDASEIRTAFASMGRSLSDEDLRLIIEEYDVDFNKQFDMEEFETMIRTTLKISPSSSNPAPAGPRRTAHDEDDDATASPAPAPGPPRLPPPAALHRRGSAHNLPPPAPLAAAAPMGPRDEFAAAAAAASSLSSSPSPRTSRPPSAMLHLLATPPLAPVQGRGLSMPLLADSLVPAQPDPAAAARRGLFASSFRVPAPPAAAAGGGGAAAARRAGLASGSFTVGHTAATARLAAVPAARLPPIAAATTTTSGGGGPSGLAATAAAAAASMLAGSRRGTPSGRRASVA